MTRESIAFLLDGEAWWLVQVHRWRTILPDDDIASAEAARKPRQCTMIAATIPRLLAPQRFIAFDYAAFGAPIHGLLVKPLL